MYELCLIIHGQCVTHMWSQWQSLFWMSGACASKFIFVERVRIVTIIWKGKGTWNRGTGVPGVLLLGDLARVLTFLNLSDRCGVGKTSVFWTFFCIHFFSSHSPNFNLFSFCKLPWICAKSATFANGNTQAHAHGHGGGGANAIHRDYT